MRLAPIAPTALTAGVPTSKRDKQYQRRVPPGQVEQQRQQGRDQGQRQPGGKPMGEDLGQRRFPAAKATRRSWSRLPSSKSPETAGRATAAPPAQRQPDGDAARHPRQQFEIGADAQRYQGRHQRSCSSASAAPPLLRAARRRSRDRSGGEGAHSPILNLRLALPRPSGSWVAAMMMPPWPQCSAIWRAISA